MGTLSLPMPRVLELIKNDRQFRSKLIEEDDNAVDIIYKYTDNPNCTTCVTQLEIFVNQNIDFINTIIRDQSASVTVVDKVADTINAPIKSPLAITPLKIAGEVYEIDADPNQFKELIETAHSERWIFRGLNVLEKVNNDGKKVWMIFFY